MKNTENPAGNRQRILTLLLALNLVLTLCTVGYLAVSRQPGRTAERGFLSGQMETGEKYILYIGTNDKDTYTQLIPTGQAREIVNAICARHTGGYTESDARGGWVDETGTLTQENTLVYEFYQIDEKALLAILDDILAELNQNSILVERQNAVYTYYSGSQDKG